MSSFVCFCVFKYCLFLLTWISWVSPVCFGWPGPVSLPWNSQWLLAGFLLSVCSCGLPWVPWHTLSLFCWSLELDIHFLHFPLNPILIYFWGKMVSIPFLSSHCSIWCCFCPWSVCNLVLAYKSKTNKTKKERKKMRERLKEINRERWWTNKQETKETNTLKKNSSFRNNRISVLVVLVLLFKHSILMLVFKQKLCLSLTRWLGRLTSFFFPVFQWQLLSQLLPQWVAACPQVSKISSVAH
jgi:hypothetical protein